MASAELLKMAHSVEAKVVGVDKRVQGVGDDVGKKVEDVDNRVQGIDGKLDDTNRPSTRPSCFCFIQNAQTCSQGTCFVTISYDGFHLQIHPRIIILQQKLITMAHLNGSSKVVSLPNGSPEVLSCGFTENVCSSSSQLRYVNPNHIDSVAGSGKSVLWFVLPRLVPPYQTHMVDPAPRSYRISGLCTTLGGPRWPTFISTLGTSTNRNFRTCFLPSSSNYPLSPNPVATSSPGSILRTIVEFRSPTIVL